MICFSDRLLYHTSLRILRPWRGFDANFDAECIESHGKDLSDLDAAYEFSVSRREDLGKHAAAALSAARATLSDQVTYRDSKYVAVDVVNLICVAFSVKSRRDLPAEAREHLERIRIA